MKELLEKISSYNLFNYLLPGTVYAFAVSNLMGIEFKEKNLFVYAFLFYFLGLVISRFGSLIIEPILKKTGFLKFAEYSDFVKASKKDDKIEILSESNNTYRTLVALIFVIGLTKFHFWLITKWIWLERNNDWIIIVLLLILFISSYRKQTNYITKRIKANLE
ncbi:conserved membrane hypothetical protein [Tenacibaculum maritimum]|uniref:hypothetical protein n=1 Tax=Tenacibaculum maritimum TaxID=107401 RepID=UPI0012E514CE|nr:hypothetical protein [Tenacibaculum maritimum]CAA0189862.1 conserved membrane hypothetical protein [Tenacibaculum maritimum]